MSVCVNTLYVCWRVRGHVPASLQLLLLQLLLLLLLLLLLKCAPDSLAPVHPSLGSQCSGCVPMHSPPPKTCAVVLLTACASPPSTFLHP